MPLPESFIEELVARNDIADVVSDYVQLTRRSGANQFGLCPFHSEKTPSFAVNSEKQIYHCFGCGKGGGVINFIMEVENLGYRDAVAFLAKRSGMEMPEDGTPEEVRSRRAKLLELNREAARFFYSMLSRPEGARAVEYIGRRGISAPMVKKFGLGAAPDSWTSLCDAMKKKGYSEVQLVDAGLAKRGKSGGVYDAFRNRLMFPVIDVRGSVIGFSGRILDADSEMAKYLNSPDTMIFQKSRNLFALNLAKKSKMGMLILAEGNIDVVSLHQAGFDGAVASLGTALTNEQARLMSKYTKKVVIAYDNDGAGQKAAQRAIGIFRDTDIDVRILKMDGAKDPDEFIKTKGRDAFAVLLDRSENDVDYRLDAVLRKYDLGTDDGRLGYLKEAIDLLATFPEQTRREVFADKVAKNAGLTAEAVKSEVERVRGQRLRAYRKREERQVMRPELTAQPAARGMRYENLVSARAEEGVVRLLLCYPELIARCDLKPGDFTSDYLGRIYSMICERTDNGDTVSLSAILPYLTPDEASQLTLLSARPITPGNSERELGDYIQTIRNEQYKKISSDDDFAEFTKQQQQKKGYGG